MTPASLALASARDDYDHVERGLWALQSLLLTDLTPWQRAIVEALRVDYRRALASALAARTAAFDAVASERSAASPVRLAARELTPDDAWVLSRADDVLSLSRRILDRSVASDHALQSGLLRAIECGDLGAAEDCREALRVGYALTAAHRFAVEGALAARAPLLAARWQEVAP